MEKQLPNILINRKLWMNIKNVGDKMINRFLSLHINNFSQLNDHESHDFKDCKELVHALQLNE
jgi:hypothetical protein